MQSLPRLGSLRGRGAIPPIRQGNSEGKREVLLVRDVHDRVTQREERGRLEVAIDGGEARRGAGEREGAGAGAQAGEREGAGAGAQAGDGAGTRAQAVVALDGGEVALDGSLRSTDCARFNAAAHLFGTSGIAPNSPLWNLQSCFSPA